MTISTNSYDNGMAEWRSWWCVHSQTVTSSILDHRQFCSLSFFKNLTGGNDIPYTLTDDRTVEHMAQPPNHIHYTI